MVEEGKFPCPRGCGRDDFKTKSAAYAHAAHCKFQLAPDENPPNPDENPPAPDGLSPEGQIILERLTDVAVAKIQQGMSGFQERVETNIMAGLAEAIPPIVAKETANMADKIAEKVKENPGAGLLGNIDQINTFLATPLGKIVEKKLIGPTGSSVSMRGLSRGMSTASRMLLSKKTDTNSMAEVILAAADHELKDRKLDAETRDFMIGLKNTAEIVLKGRPKEAEHE